MKKTLTLIAFVFGMKAIAQTEILNAAKNDFSGLVKINETLYQSQDGKSKIYIDSNSVVVRDTGKLIDKTYAYCIRNFDYIGEHEIEGLDFQIFKNRNEIIYIHIAKERILILNK